MAQRNNSSVSLGLLILRVVLGVTFFLHGWQKLNEWTVAGTTESFTQMGVPAPELMAPIITWLEFIGGVSLIIGAATRIVGILLALDMVGAVALVHGSAGFFAANGGFEFVLLLGASALALALTGPGAYAVDALFDRRKAVRA